MEIEPLRESTIGLASISGQISDLAFGSELSHGSPIRFNSFDKRPNLFIFVRLPLKLTEKIASNLAKQGSRAIVGGNFNRFLSCSV